MLLAIEQGNTERLDEISAIVRRCGGLDDARRAAQVEAQRAVDAARALPVNLWSQAMAEFDLPWGEPLALGLMVVAVVLPMLWFKRRGWF